MEDKSNEDKGVSCKDSCGFYFTEYPYSFFQLKRKQIGTPKN